MKFHYHSFYKTNNAGCIHFPIRTSQVGISFNPKSVATNASTLSVSYHSSNTIKISYLYKLNKLWHKINQIHIKSLPFLLDHSYHTNSTFSSVTQTISYHLSIQFHIRYISSYQIINFITIIYSLLNMTETDLLIDPISKQYDLVNTQIQYYYYLERTLSWTSYSLRYSRS